MHAFLALGAHGDVINILAGLRWHADQRGRPVHLVIDKSVAPLVGGCSYIAPIATPFGDYRDVWQSRFFAERLGYHDITICQIRGRDWEPPIKTASYAHDARLLVGAPESAWEVPILFDQRDRAREEQFVARLNLDPSKPLVLFNGRGYSSPFRNELELLGMLTDAMGDSAQVLNMARVKAPRLYDLLALYERAACLWTVDTATGHLAGATPQLPVIALISDRNSDWSGTLYPPTVNIVAQCRYRHWRENAESMIETVRGLVFTRTE